MIALVSLFAASVAGAYVTLPMVVGATAVDLMALATVRDVLGGDDE